MAEHNVEDHAKVYLVLRDGEWTIDALNLVGPLDGLDDGAQCVNSEDETTDHGRGCTAVVGVPPLPTLRALHDMLSAIYDKGA